MSRPYLAHYGVKGMKWHKHLFGDDAKRAESERKYDEHRNRADFYFVEANRLLARGKLSAGKRAFDKAVQETGRATKVAFDEIPNTLMLRGEDLVRRALGDGGGKF